jgi:uncharacterized protein YjbI with pentapeptide repeats
MNPEHVAIVRQGREAIAAWRRAHPDERLDLAGANLSEADLVGADLVGADLAGADLTKANLFRANLTGADLTGADLTDVELSGVQLSKASLAGADLSKADLNGAYRTQAGPSDIYQWRAYLDGASLAGANLFRADLAGADLAGADLAGADLTLARFYSTHLAGAQFTRARFSGTAFADCDLSTALGLEAVRHEGPSSIGLDTILRSVGNIPEVFLRGCGYDPIIQRIIHGDSEAKIDAFYEWLEQGGGPLQFQSCFISYTTENKAFADRLQKALNDKGIDYWYAPEHGRWGEELTTQIDREIKVRDRLILVCSQASLNNSDWVRWEIDRAMEMEKQRNKRVIFPLMIDDALLEWNHPRASRIREVLAGDFRRATRGRAFETALTRLIKGLRPS